MHPKRPAQPNPQEVTLSTETVRKHYTNDLPISSLISSGQKTQRPTLSTFTILLRKKKKKAHAHSNALPKSRLSVMSSSTKEITITWTIVTTNKKKSFQNSVFLNHSIKSQFQLQPPWIKNPTNPPKTKWIDHLKTLNSHTINSKPIHPLKVHNSQTKITKVAIVSASSTSINIKCPHTKKRYKT